MRRFQDGGLSANEKIGQHGFVFALARTITAERNSSTKCCLKAQFNPLENAQIFINRFARPTANGQLGVSDRTHRQLIFAGVVT